MAYKDKEKRKEYQRQYYAIHKARMLEQTKQWVRNQILNGLCRKCTSPVVGKSRYCAIHNYVRKQYDRGRYSRHWKEMTHRARESYKRLKMEGRCVACGVILSTEESTSVHCFSCRIISNNPGIIKGVVKYETAN